MDQCLDLPAEYHPAVQKIHCHDQSDTQILHHSHHSPQAGRHATDDVVDIRKYVCLGKILHTVHNVCGILFHITYHERVVLNQLLDPVTDRLNVPWHGLDQKQNTVDHLRNQHGYQRIDDQAECK